MRMKANHSTLTKTTLTANCFGPTVRCMTRQSGNQQRDLVIFHQCDYRRLILWRVKTTILYTIGGLQ